MVRRIGTSKYNLGDEVISHGQKGVVISVRYRKNDYHMDTFDYEIEFLEDGSSCWINEYYLKQTKRIFSDVDPYGEEDWNE